jgi:hypothetical protein
MWCLQLIPGERMVLVCLAATVAAALPAMLHQMWRPSTRGLLLCMANSGFAFFMLSYQACVVSLCRWRCFSLLACLLFWFTCAYPHSLLL